MNLFPLRKNLRIKEEFEKKVKQIDIEALKTRAEAGDVQDSYKLSVFYLNGVGVKANPKEGIRLLHFAAEKELPEAQLALALQYRLGLLVKKNDDRFFDLVEKSAKNGFDRAQKMLGELYLYDNETNKESGKKAFYWLQQAAEQGNIEAEFYLGYSYAEGIGIKKDLAEAYKWYKKAADAGEGNAQFELARFYDQGKVVDKDPKEAMLLFQLAAEQGVAKAMFYIGDKHLMGEEMPRNPEEAIFWLFLSSVYGQDKVHEVIITIVKEIKPLALIKIKRRVLRWLSENVPDLQDDFLDAYGHLFSCLVD